MRGAALTKIAARALVVTGVLVVLVSAAYVRGVEPGITFATQGIDLKIDSKGWYNGVLVPSATWALKNLVPGADKFFNFGDIKPGDYGCTVISLHVKKKDAWMCLDFKNLKSEENGVNEPESHEDANGAASGELASGLEFFGWNDDGDGKFEPPYEKVLFGTTTQSASLVLNDKTYVIGDSKYGNMCKKDTTRYVGICWCAGDLIVDFKTGKTRCDGSVLGNEVQTDSMTVDVELRAEPAKDKPKFICGTTPPKPPKGNNGVGNGEDPPPPGGGNSGNDGPGTGPGNPGGGSTAPGQCGKYVPKYICDLLAKNRNR
jgi:hypothetical protein